MAEKATVARPYAKAAFGQARERGDFASWSAVLAAAAAVAEAPGAKSLFGNPRVSGAELAELIAGVAREQGASVGSDHRNFLALLAANRRLGYLPEIFAQFEALRADAENIVDVEVASALPLSAGQKTRLSEALAQRFKRQVRIAETVDPTLVGGAIVRAGDLVIDGSLQGRLARLEQQLTQP
jgi:F-type H+-transporting ATPase subunit delta